MVKPNALNFNKGCLNELSLGCICNKFSNKYGIFRNRVRREKHNGYLRNFMCLKINYVLFEKTNDLEI